MKEWLHLIAIECEKDPRDIFLTLTANDSWDTLKSILTQYPNPSPVLHLVDVSEYIFKCFSALYEAFQGKVLVFLRLSHGDTGFRVKMEDHCIYI